MSCWKVKHFQTQSYIHAYVHTEREDKEMIGGWRLAKVCQCTWDQYWNMVSTYGTGLFLSLCPVL